MQACTITRFAHRNKRGGSDGGNNSVILKVNDVDTPTVEAFRAATANIKSGDQVRILFQYRTLKKFVVASVD